jgi:hypothetical protein
MLGVAIVSRLECTEDKRNAHYDMHVQRVMLMDEEDDMHMRGYCAMLREEQRRAALRKEALRVQDRIERARATDEWAALQTDVLDIVFSDPDYPTTKDTAHTWGGPVHVYYDMTKKR